MGKIIKFAVAFAIIFGAYHGLEYMKNQKSEIEEKEIIRPVKTVTLANNSEGGVWRYYGTLRGGRRVDLSFRVSGPIRRIAVDKGASVKRGQLLATLDPRDYQNRLKQAQSSQAQARAEFENAEANFKRYENLYKQRVVPKSTYDAQRTQMNVAKAALNAAAASTATVRDSLRDTELRAPFDGVIIDRMVENYQDITAKQTIFSLQDISMLEVIFNVPDNDVIWASRATKFPDSIRARFDAIPDRVFPLQIKEFVMQADRNTNTFPVIAVMPQQKDVALLPGMTAMVEVEVYDDEAQNALFTVPQTAIVRKSDGIFVWRFENGTVNRVPVKTGVPHNNGAIDISGEKLRNGDKIVVAGANLLHEGQKVRQ